MLVCVQKDGGTSAVVAGVPFSLAERRSEVDTNYPGWERNEQARKAIKQEIMRALINEGESDLIKQDFPEDALSYIIANYTDSRSA